MKKIVEINKYSVEMCLTQSLGHKMRNWPQLAEDISQDVLQHGKHCKVPLIIL